MKNIRIAGAQGFYGDSFMGALAIVAQKATDYLIHDALAELTLSILQKDRMEDPNTGYPRDIEALAKFLFPAAHAQGIKIVTNSGGLNPHGAALKVAEILNKQGVKNFKIAIITGDDFLDRLPELQQQNYPLNHLDTQEPFFDTQKKHQPTHANVYIGAKSITEALQKGANLILAGRIADPCLTLGILAHEFNWELNNPSTPQQLNLLASGIAVGHLLECGGQASGGNSYAEFPYTYSTANLGYPIAQVFENGEAIFTKLLTEGGIMNRNTLREQLIYEVHNPKEYITPDVIADFSNIQITDLEPNKVKVTGAKGKPRPQKLKLAIGIQEGFITEQMFFFSYPQAYQKAVYFIEAAQKIWQQLPIKIDRHEASIIGINGIHGNAAPLPPPHILDQLNEVGVRLAIKHTHPAAGKTAMASITCLGLNGPPGIVAMPIWGKINRIQLGLFPALIDRQLVQEKIEYIEI